MRVLTGDLNRRFADWLSLLPYTESLRGNIDLPEWIRTTDDRNVFREFIYPEGQLGSGETHMFHDRAILTSKNDAVTAFNNTIAGLRNTESRDYFAFDEVQNEQVRHISDYSAEFLQTLGGSGLQFTSYAVSGIN
ncbi:putative PIF1 [Erysiphe necator]|uniref:Putative PIF1 n=1 Tax=Uncinula necator TaxID=52586 RepID=A0A0B1PAL1_UNCNE|nr:putative PIF1 [Erysiphe necator]